jgi:hypothetical protein
MKYVYITHGMLDTEHYDKPCPSRVFSNKKNAMDFLDKVAKSEGVSKWESSDQLPKGWAWVKRVNSSYLIVDKQAVFPTVADAMETVGSKS